MPFLTSHYKLTAFTTGDSYLSSEDRRRFSILDNQVYFIASQIGDGVIDGWEIVELDSETVKVNPGTAIIDGFFVKTYGDFSIDLPINKRYYIYMRRLGDVISQVSCYSNVASIEFVNSSPPSIPAGLVVQSVTYNSISLKWTANSEPDVAGYNIYRSTDGSSYSLINNSESNEYTDSELEQDSQYYYKITSIDVEDNESAFSSVVSQATNEDDRIPSDPSGIETFPGNQTIQIYWDAAVSLADHYEVSITPITYAGDADGSTETYSVDNDEFNFIFTNLENGQLYKIVIKSVSITGVKSNGITATETPFYTSGAAEIENIQSSSFPLDSTSWKVALNVSWDLQPNEYSLLPDYYLISVSSGVENGSPSIYLDTSVTLYRYSVIVDGTEVTRSFSENTEYTIKIQTVTGDIISRGFIYRIKIPKYKPPEPIYNLELETTYSVSQKIVKATWQNSPSEFAYNEVTFTRTTLDEYGTVTELYNAVNYGQSISLLLKPADVINECTYEITVTPIDSYGNRGESTTASTTISVAVIENIIAGTTINDFSERPPVPREQFGCAGDDETTIYWNAADSDIIQGYKVYRATYNTAYQASDFELIAETNADTRKIKDYEVDNDTNYSYFITTVDLYGRESLNPSDDYISYPLIILKPHAYQSLTKPNEISVISSGFDAIISWQLEDGDFDGYEIYRSFDNKYSFEYAGSVGFDETSFTDVSALLKSGSYYYIIRKFRNEAEVVVSRSKISPTGSLLLGIISHTPSGIAITDSRFIIKNLLAPIQEDMYNKLHVSPTHLFYNLGDDRRIRLQNNLVVTADQWSTEDYQTYTTEVSLSSTNEYVAYINGEQSAFSSKVIAENGQIVFDSKIYDASSGDEIPQVSVIFKDVYETSGILKIDNIENITANRITKGILSLNAIPSISHFGRYREELIPKSYDAVINNPYYCTYTISDGTTFYDIAETGDNLLIAATSGGIKQSSANKTKWDTLFVTENPSTKISYSQELDMYFCVSGNEVRYSTDRESWKIISGTSSSSIVRELIVNEETLFITTDNGVYYCNPLDFTKIFWTQMPLFNEQDANAFGAYFYDEYLYVSGSNGIFKTNDYGENWIQISGDEISVPCFSIDIVDDYIFAVSNNRVWRKKPLASEFVDIGDFPFACRKCKIFYEKLYITTDKGLHTAKSNFNVFSDDNIEWELAFKNIQRNGKTPVTCSLNIINNRLWLGQDERVYSVTQNNKVYLQVNEQSIVPTIYVNGKESGVGVYYNKNNKILFDMPLQSGDSVKVTTSYNDFLSLGGLVDTKFDAEIDIWINGSKLVGSDLIQVINGRQWRFPAEPFKCSADPTYVINSLNQLLTPFFNERVSNFVKAKQSLTSIVQLADSIQTMADNGDVSVPSSVVSEIFRNLDLFKSYIQPELREFIAYPKLTGSFTANGYMVNYDVVSGDIEITGPVDKYSSCQLSVNGVSFVNSGEFSHNEIEDALEKYNSGLSISLANVQQSNIIKSGIWFQEVYPDEISDFEFQSSHYSACDNNWYDNVRSTVEYNEKIYFKPNEQGTGSNKNIGFSLDYVADTLYIEDVNEVWTCGDGGILSINVDTKIVRKIITSEFYFYNMSLSEGIVYALAEDGIYQIDTDTLVVTKMVDLDIPQKSRSIYINLDTIFITAEDGVYSKKPFEQSFTRILEINNAIIKSNNDLVFAIGSDPLDSTNSLVYYSFGGNLWNRTSFKGIKVYSVSRQGNYVYYATDSGLLVEDLTRLFEQQEFSGPTIYKVTFPVG